VKIVADLKSVSNIPVKVTYEAILCDALNFGLELCITEDDPEISIPHLWKHEDCWGLVLSIGLKQFEDEVKVLLAKKAASVDDSSSVRDNVPTS
jgi:hypothetical protein